jgi:hypothetical protein
MFALNTLSYLNCNAQNILWFFLLLLFPFSLADLGMCCKTATICLVSLPPRFYHAVSPLSLMPVVSLVHYSPFGMLYSTATMTIPFKLTDYQRSFFFQCLTPCLVSLPPRFYHAVSPSCCLSFLSCLSHNILLLVCCTVLQQWHSTQIHWLPNAASSFSVSFHVLSLSRRAFIMQCLRRPSLLLCLSHITLLLVCFTALQQWHFHSNSMNTKRSFSFSVSSHVLSLSRCVFIMQYLLPAVPHSCRVSRQ